MKESGEAADRRIGAKTRERNLKPCVLIKFGIRVNVDPSANPLEAFGGNKPRDVLLTQPYLFTTGKSEDAALFDS